MLQQQLQARVEEFAGQAPPEVFQALRQAAIELAQSGIAGRCLREGAEAPDFTLPAINGTMVQLSDRLARGPAVVSFYRGGW
jgi:hypothetical protein